MSRSRQKFPFVGITTATSCKEWRREYNRKHRHNQKQLINKHLAEGSWDDFISRVLLDDSSVYDSPLDGKKHWWGKPHENASFNPRTEEFDYEWRTVEVWKKIFRK